MAAKPRKNVLLFLADQWRGDTLRNLGHRFVDTPAIDALASKTGRRQPRRHETQASAIRRRDRSIRDELTGELQGLGLDACHVRSSSLIDVFARVCASTRFTMTAQDKAYFPSADGRLPGTTTDPEGTRP